MAAGEGLAAVDEWEREILARYFPGARTADELRAIYEGFVGAADERFQKLEEGDADEVALWRRMVEWSLADFQSFYTALGIDIDFVIGESFYLDAGNSVVDEAIDTGTAFELTKQRVCEEVAELDRAVAAEEITAQVRDKSVALLEKDIGAIVVPLPGGERLVVRRSDGRSVYATRDIGAIKLRRRIFDPTDINYVVGRNSVSTSLRCSRPPRCSASPPPPRPSSSTPTSASTSTPPPARSSPAERAWPGSTSCWRLQCDPRCSATRVSSEVRPSAAASSNWTGAGGNSSAMPTRDAGQDCRTASGCPLGRCR